ncbi:MAG: hypothetical protein H7831_11625 [Magnetococcus sp. WYHC-3]
MMKHSKKSLMTLALSRFLQEEIVKLYKFLTEEEGINLDKFNSFDNSDDVGDEDAITITIYTETVEVADRIKDALLRYDRNGQFLWEVKVDPIRCKDKLGLFVRG